MNRQKKAPEKPNWNDIADFYDKMAMMELRYTREHLAFLGLRPEDTVLDVGCGPGRISITAAEQVGSLTALDSAEKMLEYAGKHARERNITNMKTVLMDWDDVVPGENLEKHDVVIASRTGAIGEPEKLSALANRLAVIYIWANAPSIPQLVDRLFEGTEEAKKEMPDHGRENGYIRLIQKIYDLGYEVNSRIVEDGFEKNFLSRQEAYDFLWSLRPGLPEEKKPILEANADKYLTEKKGVIHFSMKTRMVCIYWNPVTEGAYN